MLNWVVEPRTWQWHVETAWIAEFAGQVPRGPRSDHRRIVNQQATTAFACILACPPPAFSLPACVCALVDDATRPATTPACLTHPRRRRRRRNKPRDAAAKRALRRQPQRRIPPTTSHWIIYTAAGRVARGCCSLA